VNRKIQVVEDEHRQQHQQRAHHREQEELDRCVYPPGAAPDSDDEVHRNQHRFPEHVELEEVQRYERAEHPRLEAEHEKEVVAQRLRDVVPGSQQNDGHEERREKHQQQADTVDTHEIVDAVFGNPRNVFHELETRFERIKDREKAQ